MFKVPGLRALRVLRLRALLGGCGSGFEASFL